MYTNQELTGFRVGRKTTAGTLIYHEKATDNQVAFFDKQSGINPRIGNQQALSWFDEIITSLYGINQIINPKEPPQETPEKRNLNYWKLFISITLIIITALFVIHYISNKA